MPREADSDEKVTSARRHVRTLPAGFMHPNFAWTMAAHLTLRLVSESGVCRLARKVCCGYETPCAYRDACVGARSCELTPAQMPRLEKIHANLVDRLTEGNEQGQVGEVAAIEITMAAATPTVCAADLGE